LYMIENGRTNPRITTLIKIANTLEITLSDLLLIEGK
jgi:DNA-binding XRE family transcriptional regulator